MVWRRQWLQRRRKWSKIPIKSRFPPSQFCCKFLVKFGGSLVKFGGSLVLFQLLLTVCCTAHQIVLPRLFLLLLLYVCSQKILEQYHLNFVSVVLQTKGDIVALGRLFFVLHLKCRFLLSLKLSLAFSCTVFLLQFGRRFLMERRISLCLTWRCI